MSDPVTLALRLPPGRHLIGVAGAPASGKSTLAERMAHELTRLGRPAKMVPMDGFHLDNAILDARGDRPRKGAPHTFDARGFARMLTAMKTGGTVYYPLFDRARDLSIACAGVVDDTTELIIVEGNYLLYDHPEWRDLAALWSLAIFVDMPIATLRARLMQRWREHGLDGEAAFAKLRENDIPNAEDIIAHRLPATITVATD